MKNFLNKKLLSFVLSVVLIIAVIPFGAFTVSAETTSGKCGDNLTWEYDSTTHTLTISGTGDMNNYGYCNSPWYSNHPDIKTVNIGNGVMSIGNYAFYNCIGLTSLTIGNSVTSIGERAFTDCTGLTSVTIPDGVTSIRDYAFYNCTGITSVTIGNSITSFGFCAFCKCTGLTSVTIGDGVTSIGNYAFSSCTRLTSVTIPNSVTSIGYVAFSGCTGLTSITIPNSVTSIGDSAFYECTGLKTVTIGSSVTSIGDGAFNGCTNLNYNTYDNALYLGNSENPYIVLIKAIQKSITSCIINSSTKFIYSSAFNGCTGLTSITIPNSVTSIRDFAFEGCTGLTKVNISDLSAWCKISFGVSNPLEYAKHLYIDDKEVTNLVIPEDVTSINDYAFSGCTGIETITIPNTVSSIGVGAFPQSVTIYGTPSTVAETYALSNGNKFIPLPDFIEVFFVKKANYFVGGNMDPNTIIIASYFANGEVKFYYKGFDISGFDTKTAGTKIVTVDYFGKKSSFKITVTEAKPGDLITAVDIILGRAGINEKYDYSGDGVVDLLDLVSMKKQLANM